MPWSNEARKASIEARRKRFRGPKGYKYYTSAGYKKILGSVPRRRRSR